MRPLGNIDGSMTWLGSVLRPALAGIAAEREDVCTNFEEEFADLAADEVGCSLLTGLRGRQTTITDPEREPYERRLEGTEYSRTGVLFHLPRNRLMGTLAVHTADGVSPRSLIDGPLRTAVADAGCTLVLRPVVDFNAFRAAVQAHRMRAVLLTKEHPAAADQFADAAQYGPELVGRAELRLVADRGVHLLTDPVERFLADPTDENRLAILRFGELTFDEAQVEVDMPDGTRKRYFIQDEESGRAMSIGLGLAPRDQYGAVSEDIVIELRRAVETVTPPA